ncbi:MAG: hypothetical protein U0573_03290 [Phycisphaerales bacterium]|nr:hypothetical protein [Planctomycetota bacterium]
MRGSTNGRLHTSLAALGVAATLASATAGAGDTPLVLYVDKTAPAGGDGTTWQKAFNDLQTAIQSVERNYSIDRSHIEYRVAQGTYTPDQGTKNRNMRFSMDGVGSAMTLSLIGSFAGLQGANPDKQDYVSTRTILSGDINGDDGPNFTNRADNSFSIAILSARSSITIDGITVRGADSTGGGYYYAIQALATDYFNGPPTTTLTVSNSDFEDNRSPNGSAGGLTAMGDLVYISRCRFRGNVSIGGGSGGLITLTTDPMSLVEDCLFESNSCTGYGGGMKSEGPSRVERCIFVNNSAGTGGGLAGTFAVRASLFVRNTAKSYGGAINGDHNCLIRSCTIANNTSKYGAIDISDGTIVSSSIIWGNTMTGAAQALWVSNGLATSTVDHCTIQNGAAGIFTSGLPTVVGAGIKSTDPRFIRPALPADPAAGWQSWNYRLKAGSPAIGAGGDLVDFDLDGNLYSPSLGPPDAGAYFITSTVCAGNLSHTDSVVNDDDFVIFLRAYRLMVSPPADPAADLNHDGLVNDADFSIFAAAYDRLICP